MSEWISVRDRLPVHRGDVQIYVRGGKQCIGWCDNTGKWTLLFNPCEGMVKDSFEDFLLRNEVTHWQPLPQPPDKGE